MAERQRGKSFYERVKDFPKELQGCAFCGKHIVLGLNFLLLAGGCLTLAFGATGNAEDLSDLTGTHV